MRAQGRKYVEILQSGGGIHHTTELVRNSTEEELFLQSKRYAEDFLSHGVVGIECKSGYGLDVENELKQLRVIKRLHQTSFLKISSTFLGLHARPKDRSLDDYLDELKGILPYIKEENLAQFVDAFCDAGAYAPDEIEQFMTYAKTLGFDLRLHADEIENVGATKLGIELGAKSVDHVLKISDSDISALSRSNVMVTLMPNTSFYLGEGFAPARKLIDSGIAIALGSDFNPGSAPIYQPSFVMHLAIRFLKMEPEEVLTAYTANGAYLLGINSGIVAPSFSADLVLWRTSEFIDIPYMFQENFVEHVLIDGRIAI
jgi:imidazolonepropionase